MSPHSDVFLCYSLEGFWASVHSVPSCSPACHPLIFHHEGPAFGLVSFGLVRVVLQLMSDSNTLHSPVHTVMLSICFVHLCVKLLTTCQGFWVDLAYEPVEYDVLRERAVGTLIILMLGYMAELCKKYVVL